MSVQRVVLVGLSGTGKSTIASAVATRLSWRLIDLDADIEGSLGKSIPEVFREDGEPFFRERERMALRQSLDAKEAVIATGGGAVCRDDAWDGINDTRGTLVIRLDAPSHVIVRRLAASQARRLKSGRTTIRPLLDVADPYARMEELRNEREPWYSRAAITIPVDERTADATVSDICELVRLGSRQASTITLTTQNAASEIHVGTGVRKTLFERLEDVWPRANTLWVGVDENVASLNLDGLPGLPGAVVPKRISVHTVPSGEASKSLEHLSHLYDWMLEGGVERSDVALALGGGVVGDLVGFAAATVLRGIGLVQMPTTLLSMVDSSVGGKTGIDHPAGKNLIGAFYQPRLVLVDPSFLATLPRRQVSSGYAEVIKHSVIQASTPGGERQFLYKVLRANSRALLAREEPLTSWVIRQNIQLKASVVAADERESRLRSLLNFGHTFGHAIEASGYTLLHGEAVAVGMHAAMILGERKGLIDADYRREVLDLLAEFDLPLTAQVPADAIRQHMSSDKKKISGKQQWILPLRGGGADITTQVFETDIDAAIEGIQAV